MSQGGNVIVLHLLVIVIRPPDSTIRKITLPIHLWIIDIAEEAGFLIKEHFVDTVKAGRIPPKRYGHSSVIGQEHILIFKKPRGK
jgi:hypothetical protein